MPMFWTEEDIEKLASYLELTKKGSEDHEYQILAPGQDVRISHSFVVPQPLVSLAVVFLLPRKLVRSPRLRWCIFAGASSLELPHRPFARPSAVQLVLVVAARCRCPGLHSRQLRGIGHEKWKKGEKDGGGKREKSKGDNESPWRKHGIWTNPFRPLVHDDEDRGCWSLQHSGTCYSSPHNPGSDDRGGFCPTGGVSRSTPSKVEKESC